MDPDEALAMAAPMRQTYEDAEQIMLQRVSRRLNRGITTPGWNEAKLAEVGELRSELASIVDRADRVAATDLDKILTNAYRRGSATALQVLGPESLPVTGLLPRTNIEAVQALYRQATGDIARANFQILRSSLDQYRAIVARNAGLAVGGVLTRQELTQRMLNQWADIGVTGFTDKAGRRWSMGAYAEMTARTSVTRSHLQGRVGTFLDKGYNLVIVSDSPEECPFCRPWERRVLSIGGQVAGYPRLEDAQGAGLFHGNCTHSVNLYSEGMEEFLKPAEANPEGYEERQKQRHMERQIRRWKNREAVALDDEAKRYARAKVRAWQGQMLAFVDEKGRKRLYYREGISKARPPAVPPPGPPSVAPPRPPAPVKFTETSAQKMDDVLKEQTSSVKADKEILNTAIHYSQQEFTPINAWLRTGKKISKAAVQKEIEANVTRLVSAMRPVPSNVKVMRAFDLDAFPGGKLPKVGSVFEDKAFLSTTVDREVVTGIGPFANTDVLLEIEVPEGTSALWMKPLSKAKGEEELLLAPGQRIRIDKVWEEPVPEGDPAFSIGRHTRTRMVGRIVGNAYAA